MRLSSLFVASLAVAILSIALLLCGLGGAAMSQTATPSGGATKQRNDVYGEHPIGYAALTAAGRLFAVITANGRKPPNGSEEQAAAFRSMIAYTGKFRVESEKFIAQVDTAWNEAWVGTEQVRVWRVDGDKLHITSAPIPNPNVPGGKMIGVQVWERD